MPRIEIIELNFAATAVDKIWRHGVTPRQAGSVLSRRWVTTRNRTHRAAPYLLIGRDDRGRCLNMPIVPTDHPRPLFRRIIRSSGGSSPGGNANRAKPRNFDDETARGIMMNQSIRSEPIHEALDDEEPELMNLDNWDWDDTAAGVTAGEPRASLTIPFSFEELDAIVDAAAERGLSTSEFIKHRVLDGLQAGNA